MAQMSEQLQQLSQQLSDQQEMLQQIVARDCQTKAFSEMRGVKGDENAWSGWVYEFRIEAARCFRQEAAILYIFRSAFLGVLLEMVSGRVCWARVLF